MTGATRLARIVSWVMGISFLGAPLTLLFFAAFFNVASLHLFLRPVNRLAPPVPPKVAVGVLPREQRGSEDLLSRLQAWGRQGRFAEVVRAGDKRALRVWADSLKAWNPAISEVSVTVLESEAGIRTGRMEKTGDGRFVQLTVPIVDDFGRTAGTLSAHIPSALYAASSGDRPRRTDGGVTGRGLTRDLPRTAFPIVPSWERRTGYSSAGSFLLFALLGLFSVLVIARSTEYAARYVMVQLSGDVWGSRRMEFVAAEVGSDGGVLIQLARPRAPEGGDREWATGGNRGIGSGGQVAA